MNTLNRVRSSLHGTFFSSEDTDTGSGPSRLEESAILNRRFSLYHRFDLSTGSEQQIETSLQTLNQSINTSSSQTPIIDTNADDAEFLSKNSKRTLRTIPGVFCPIALSMFALSIFIRMGFVLAHAGVLQTLLQLSLCFVILFCTLLSVCSLATNGAIEGGGVYHMISRALGPEFGGAIGALFFFANVISNGQSVVALVEVLVESFGPGSKRLKFNKNENENDLLGKANFFHATRWWRFLYGTLINLVSLITCLLGSSLFSIAAFFIFILVCFVYLMVVISFFIRDPHHVLIPKVNTYAYNNEALSYNKTDFLYGYYTGFSSATMKGNIYTNYTIDYTTGDIMDFSNVFVVLFSSITGLLAGANMSGMNF
jgi:potassium/chloride transporter 9